jgi:hypothetical protein
MKNDLKRWRKQTRVNGIETHTLRLRHIPDDKKGIILSLILVQEKDNLHLSIEADGDYQIDGEYDEYRLLIMAQTILLDAASLVDPQKQAVIDTLRKE